MRNLLLISTLLTLAACSGEAPPPTGAADEGATAPEDVVVASDTHLVDNPPTYPSVPLPEGLEWLTNEDDPVFASPDAKRGGTFRTYITGFPLTLRMHGPDGNSGSYVPITRSMRLALLDLHPNTLKFTPSLATHWAFGADGKTVYFKLDPRARWSDGEPVTADDYVFAREMRLSDFIVDPYGKNYFSTQIVNIAKHDDHTISVVTATSRPPDEMLYEHNLSPEPRHFHKLDADWVKDYDWLLEPTTGAYHTARVEKGRFVELERIGKLVGRRAQIQPAPLQRRHDPRRDHSRRQRRSASISCAATSTRYALGVPARWHEKAVGEPFDKGYIHKIQFYNDVPREARGMWLNMDDAAAERQERAFRSRVRDELGRRAQDRDARRLPAAADAVRRLLLGLFEPDDSAAPVRPRARRSLLHGRGLDAARSRRHSRRKMGSASRSR